MITGKRIDKDVNSAQKGAQLSGRCSRVNCELQTTPTFTHSAISAQITSYYSCPHAQTRLSLVNYSQFSRDLAADRYPARVAESFTLQLLLHNPMQTHAAGEKQGTAPGW